MLLLQSFHERHREFYGYDMPEQGVEIVNLRLVVTAARGVPPAETAVSGGNLVQALVRVAASSPVVSQVKKGAGTPLFLCHGDFDGWGLYARRLVELLRHDGPVYLLHSNLDREEQNRRYREFIAGRVALRHSDARTGSAISVPTATLGGLTFSRIAGGNSARTNARTSSAKLRNSLGKDRSIARLFSVGSNACPQRGS